LGAGVAEQSAGATVVVVVVVVVVVGATVVVVVGATVVVVVGATVVVVVVVGATVVVVADITDGGAGLQAATPTTASKAARTNSLFIGIFLRLHELMHGGFHARRTLCDR